jgi:hypothetical protein
MAWSPDSVSCKAKLCNKKRSMPTPYCDYHLELWREGGIDAVNFHETESAKKFDNELKNIIVTTGDISSEYEIIGPVYFSLNNAGILSSQYENLVNQYRENIRILHESEKMNRPKFDWSFLYGEYSFGMGSHFDQAFFISVEELKKRTLGIGGDGIIHLRQDIDIDTNGFQRFYLQIYGTAVKLKDRE